MPITTASDSTKAEADLREAVGTLDKVGDWFGIFSHHILRHIHAIRGDIPRQLAEAETEITIGVMRGDNETLAWGLYGKADAFARAGRTREAHELAIRAVALTKQNNSITDAVAYEILGYVCLQASEYEGARQAVERSRAAIVRTFCPFEFVGPAFPLLVESLLGPYWIDKKKGPSPSSGA